jgi:myo-inositol 2-dehydrogenase/D-chiro-inositol 1-dehydrogenase
MRIVVVGAGRMGAVRVEDLAADPRVDEVLVTNRTQARAVELAERFGARPVEWSALDGLRIDGTVVALATEAHAGPLAQVVRRGGPVLCEKPIALTLADTASVIALAARHGATLQIGFQRRFDAGMRAVRDRIVAGRLGTVYALRMVSHDHAPSSAEFLAGSGGIFRDLHVHDLDLVRWLTNDEIATVFATSAVRAHPQYAQFDDADVSLIHAVTRGGVQVSVHGARHDPLGHDVRLEALGSLDSVTTGLNHRTPLRALDDDLATNAAPYVGFVDRFRDAFRHETAAFVGLVAAGGASPCPPESALESLRAAIACERSVATGAPVRVADVHPEGR